MDTIIKKYLAHSRTWLRSVFVVVLCAALLFAGRIPSFAQGSSDASGTGRAETEEILIENDINGDEGYEGGEEPDPGEGSEGGKEPDPGENPEPPKVGLVFENDHLYFYQEDGTVFTGGYKEVPTDSGVKYYWFDADGAAFTGGYKAFSKDGKRVYYYFQQDGSAYTDGYLRFSQGGKEYDYFFQENGAAFTNGYKEVTIGGNVYYFYFLANGQSFKTGYKTVNIDGKKYYFYFDQNGRALVNTIQAISLGNRTAYYLFEADGKAFTAGYKEVPVNGGKDYYYFLANGQAFTGGYKTVKIDGTTYYFFFEKDGKAFTGGRKDITFGTNSYTYHFQSNGRAYSNTKVLENGVWCYYQENGRLRNGLQQVDGKTYYFLQGVPQTGLIAANGKHYYFEANGEMIADKVISIGHAKYKFGPDGAQVPMTLQEIGKTTNGHHTFVYNYTDDILMYYNGNLYDTLYPASTTKTLTCAIALQILNPDEVITLGNELLMCEYSSSKAYLPAGGKITVKDLTAAVMVPSGSDAAWAIAYHAGRKLTAGQNLTKMQTVQAFLDELNRRGKEMGLVHTNFTAPDGFPDYDGDEIPDSNHYTCMADMIKIASLAVSTPTLYEVAGKAEYRWSTPGYITQVWDTCVPFLATYSKYYDPNVTGLKTGTSTPAGCCILVTVVYEGKTFIIGTFGSKQTDGRFQDVCMLRDLFVYGK